MKNILVLLLACTACVRQITLPVSSQHNVIGLLNDSTWFATGKAVRLVKPSEQPNSVRQFNLQIKTDINYPGNGSTTRSKTITGGIGDFVPTQILYIYNIPLKKGKYKIATLDKRRTVDVERLNYWLVINGSGVYKNYQFEGSTPNWIRITSYNQISGILEGQFALLLDVNKQIGVGARGIDKTAPIARFKHGLFRVKLDDVKLKE